MPGLEKTLEEDFDKSRPAGFFATVQYTALWACQKCGKSIRTDANTHTNNILNPSISVDIALPPGWTLDHTITLRCNKCSDKET